MRLLLIYIFLFLAVQAAAQDRPNILLIIADDLGVDPLNGYHDANFQAVTPTLDSLRAAGITFINGTASPVCSPTRAAIMSGQYGVKNGVLGVPGDLANEEQTVFKGLAAQTDDAYADALIGKWHLTQPLQEDDPPRYGVTSYDGFLRGGVDDYFAWSRVQNGTASISTEYVTTALTNAAIDWIDEQTQPWFLWLAHAAPHGPFHTPPADLFSINGTDTDTRKYIAMIEALDAEMGRMFGAMDEDVRENTLVIFVGDNGTPRNVLQDYPNGRGKGTIYQGGVRVPFIVSGKGVTRAGAREEALVHVTDIHATILEAAGTQVQGNLFNSLSFYHLLSDETEAMPTRDYNYIEVDNGGENNSGWAIRNARYKLITFDSGDQEFYDLRADSFELNALPIGQLSAELTAVYADLEAEAAVIRSGWSCRDHIRNGEETEIDCGSDVCGVCTTGTTNFTSRIDVLLYPNPFVDYFVVDALGEGIEAVRIFDANGRLLHRAEGQGMRILEVEVSGLPTGILLVEVRTEAGGLRVMKAIRN